MDALHALAARVGVDARYQGWRGEPVEASRDALIAVLAALGHEVTGEADASAALAAADRAWWEAGAAPVVVGWDGGDAALGLRLRADLDGAWRVTVEYEDGEIITRTGTLFELPASGHVDRGGRPWCLRHVVVAGRGVTGYHRIRWTVGDRTGEARWLAAPARAFGDRARSWGVFAPLHALRTARSGDAGDLAELARLAAAVSARGGRYVATLPLLAAFLDEPCEPSPYAPASRMFWNELYLTLPEASPLAPGPLVDYRAQYRWRREVIDRLAAAAWAGGEADELLAFARAGEVGDYAAFRALGEQLRTGWARWPAELRDPPAPWSAAAIAAGETPVDPARWRSHVWAQRAMEEQLHALDAAGAELYLDLPVGVNRDAWEVWRHRDAFVLDASTGAPPDALFLGGQDWGLPPLHPERIRARGWDYVIACIRHHVRHAGMLRIDHVMGLHRLYWVPAGMRATEGLYVRYAHEELYAILCLESHRHRCAMVGEDLGTVPPEVPPAMRRHNLAGLHVAQFSLPGALGLPLGAAHADQVASLNTHDTPTWAGWWHGLDIGDKLDLGLIDAAQADRERAERVTARRAVLAAVGIQHADPDGDDACAVALLAVTRALAAGDAGCVLATLEDAWLERRPQNVPGTAHERPNWRRPFSLDADAALADQRVLALLRASAR